MDVERLARRSRGWREEGAGWREECGGRREGGGMRRKVALADGSIVFDEWLSTSETDDRILF